MRNRRTLMRVTCIVIFTWSVYVIATAKWKYIEYSLDAEDPQTAEFAYWQYFQFSNVEKGVRLAIDPRQLDTIRFYAACRLADILTTNDDNRVATILKEVDNAPPMTPFFYGSNNINKEFFNAQHVMKTYRVKDVVNRRMSINYHKPINEKSSK